MNRSRFEPWNIVNILHRDLYPQSLRRSPDAATGQPPEVVRDWIPAVDIIEEKTRFVLRADLPGVSADDIDISMDKSVLTLAGQRTTETAEDAKAPRRTERRFGKFHRQFSLPETVDAEQISARCTNGILEVSIPKLADVGARRIEVQAA